MEKLVVECMECSYLMLSKTQDGIRCYECGGRVLPIGYVTEKVKEDDIRITDVSLETNSISCDAGIVEHILAGTKVSFVYKDISASLFIKSNRLLSVEEMKREILNRFSIKEINVKEDM